MNRPTQRPLRALAAAGSACVLTAALTAPQAAADSAGPAAGGAAPAAAPNPSALQGVAATSARNVWAVGYRFNGTADRALIEHWNGTSWRQVRSPRPPGAAVLYGVAATSARNAWAVGSYAIGTARYTLAEHWNGRSWKIVPSPGPCPGTPGNELRSVAAVSARNAWAVGTGTGCKSGNPVTLILHWNGRSWRRAKSENTGLDGGGLLGVAATSARNAWAVGFSVNGTLGQTLIERWNGRSWKQVPSPDPVDASIGLAGVAATSARNAWAVGTVFGTSVGTDEGLILHGKGKSWKLSPSPSQPGEQLNAVAASSARLAWAVGSRVSGTALQTLVERWNGRSWKRVSSPSPGPELRLDGLDGVTASSATHAWAAGQYSSGSTDVALIERWNGRSWRVKR